MTTKACTFMLKFGNCTRGAGCNYSHDPQVLQGAKKDFTTRRAACVISVNDEGELGEHTYKTEFYYEEEEATVDQYDSNWWDDSEQHYPYATPAVYGDMEWYGDGTQDWDQSEWPTEAPYTQDEDEFQPPEYGQTDDEEAGNGDDLEESEATEGADEDGQEWEHLTDADGGETSDSQ